MPVPAFVSGVKCKVSSGGVDVVCICCLGENAVRLHCGWGGTSVTVVCRRSGTPGI